MAGSTSLAVAFRRWHQYVELRLTRCTVALPHVCEPCHVAKRNTGATQLSFSIVRSALGFAQGTTAAGQPVRFLDFGETEGKAGAVLSLILFVASLWRLCIVIP